MKKVKWLMLLSLLVVVFAIPTYAGTKVSPKSAVMVVGQAKKLKVNTKKKVKWSSKNKRIASVTSNGVVKAKKKGSTTIYAKVNGKKYSCKVTVYDPSEYLTRQFSPIGNDIVYISSLYGDSRYEDVVTINRQQPRSGNYIKAYMTLHVFIENTSESDETPHNPFYYVYIDKILVARYNVPFRTSTGITLNDSNSTSGTHTVEIVCYENGNYTSNPVFYKKIKYKMNVTYI